MSARSAPNTEPLRGVRDRHTSGMPNPFERAVSFLHGLDRGILTATLQRVVGIVKRDQSHRHMLCVALPIHADYHPGLR